MQKHSEKSKQVVEKLDKLQSEIDSKIESAGDKAQKYWTQAGAMLTSMRDEIKEFGQNMETAKDEARVQARLGIMDANEKWLAVQDDLESFAEQVKNKSAEASDAAKLQAQLAELKTKAAARRTGDYIKENSERLKEEATSKSIEVLDAMSAGIDKIKSKLSS